MRAPSAMFRMALLCRERECGLPVPDADERVVAGEVGWGSRQLVMFQRQQKLCSDFLFG